MSTSIIEEWEQLRDRALAKWNALLAALRAVEVAKIEYIEARNKADNFNFTENVGADQIEDLIDIYRVEEYGWDASGLQC